MEGYLNPGNDVFRNHLKNKMYVDKSGLIACLNDYMSNDSKYFCVSRPRRFGKSYAADMLTAYYGRGVDSHSLFDGLEISKTSDYETHINKYNVIHGNMTELISDDMDILTGLAKFKKNLVKELMAAYPEMTFDDIDVLSVLKNVYNHTNIRFVFIFDEWDCPFRENKFDVDGQKSYLRFLRDLLKDREYVALAYMTGILPIKKYGTHSALNMFKEISMTDAEPLQKYMGFTEDEVKVLCGGDKDKEDGIREWYDGYTVNGVRIYNPYAVGEAVQSSEPLHGLWTETETYEALEIYIKTNAYGVQDDLIDLIGGKPVEVQTDGFTNDMITFRDRDDVLTLLIHLGYLTMTCEDGKKYVRIPNREVKEQFLKTMKRIGLGNPDNVLPTSQKIFDATLKGDTKTVARLVEDIHQERTSAQDYNEEISLKYVIQFAYIAAESHYSMVREMPAGKGFADMVFIPIEKNPAYPPMVAELKVRGPKSGAMSQIKKKEYYRFLKGYEGDVVLVGIHYNRRTKEHTCQIKRVKV